MALAFQLALRLTRRTCKLIGFSGTEPTALGIGTDALGIGTDALGQEPE